MMPYYPVCAKDDLPDGQRKIIDVEGISILVCHIDGVFYAFENRCSHADLPLSDAHIEDNEIVCPFHGARFCLKTGDPRQAPAFGGIQTFSVIEQDRELFIFVD
jgi:3-phenylpropionate/trans-cinnamate dioxygenase ferredoxin component